MPEDIYQIARNLRIAEDDIQRLQREVANLQRTVTEFEHRIARIESLTQRYG